MTQDTDPTADHVIGQGSVMVDVLRWLGIALIAIGLLLGFRPVVENEVACGSAFRGGGTPGVVRLSEAEACEDAVASRRTLAFGALVAGGISVAASMLVARRRT